MKLNFETLTPLHIYSGDELAQNIRYVIENDELFVLNNMKVSSLLASKKVFDFNRKYSIKEIQKIVKDNGSQIAATCSDYAIKTTNRFNLLLGSENKVGMTYVMEFINSNGKMYIPGSSVKGALLTILHKSSLGIVNDISEKFVIRDSEALDAQAFSVYRTEIGRPPINLICLDAGETFSLEVPKLGTLKIEELKTKLKEYYSKQIPKAYNKIKTFVSHKNKEAGANLYVEALESFLDIDLGNDQYLINLGFGSGSWFKLYDDVIPPKFRKPGRHGAEQEAHTSFLPVDDDGFAHIGWCLLTIEE
jgi:hypothetical protein